MRHLKLLCTTALATLALTAIVAGSASASAKVCSGEGTGPECGGTHGKQYTGPLTANLATGTADFASAFVTIKCGTSHVAGSVTSPSTGTAQITTMTFANCTNGSGQACTYSTNASAANPWHVTFRTGVAPSGFMNVKALTRSFTCSGVTCHYALAEAGTKNEISVVGGKPATMLWQNVPLAKEAGSSFLCSSTATWSGHYAISTPSSLYLT